MATGQLYEVFARRTRDDGLGHVVTVNATSIDIARVYARTTYDEENWIEMIVVERAAMIPVIELEPLVEFKEAE